MTHHSSKLEAWVHKCTKKTLPTKLPFLFSLENMVEDRDWVTQPDEYVCSLKPETQEMAEEELREDPKERTTSLDSMRKWIMENPKILNCRLGTYIK